MITVYIDVLFAVNFLINALITEGTGLIINEETKWYRSVLSALFGAGYATWVFFTSVKFAQSFFMKIVLSQIMVLIAFKIKNRRHFFKMWGAFYLVSFIFGGSIIALLSMTNLGSMLGGVYSNGSIYLNLPWEILCLSGAATYFMIYIFGKIRKKRVCKEAVSRQLAIGINGEKIETKAIIDTGNSLFDPITGVPVIVCEYDRIKSVIDLGEKDNIVEKMHEAGLRVRLIPFSGVGVSSALMPAFLPDWVTIDNYRAKSCIVGISLNKLSTGGEYHALLNPAINIE